MPPGQVASWQGRSFGARVAATAHGLDHSRRSGRIGVRLDDGFAHPALIDFQDPEPNLEYLVTMAKNLVLKHKTRPAIRQASRLSRQRGQAEHVSGPAHCAAKTWPRPRRVVLQAEVVRAKGKSPKGNPHFVIAQYEAEAALALQKSVLPTRRNGESHNRTLQVTHPSHDRRSC
jgi:hypothetical protein